MTGDGDNSKLPDLDYALLADFAKVEPHGSLSIIGGSFLRMTVSALPALVSFAVAGRARVAEGGHEVLDLECVGPNESGPTVAFSIPLQGAPEATYDGRAGVLFSANISMPILEAGAARVTLSINGSLVRSLQFRVEPVQD